MAKLQPRRSFLAYAALAVAWSGCAADAGSPCAVNSDCAAGLWCDPRAGICAEVACEGQDCTIPPFSMDTPPPADAADGTEDTPVDGGTDGGEAADVVSPPECPAQEKTGVALTWRATSVHIGKSGRPPEGLDVDGNPSTCAPADDCEAGIDNGFAGVAGAVNLFYESATKDGSLRLGVVLTDTGCGELRLVFVEGAEGAWAVSPMSRAGGAYKTAVGPAKAAETSLDAGPGGRFRIPLLVLGALVEVEIESPRAEGKIDGDGAVVTWAGVLQPDALEAGVRSIPEEELSLVGGYEGALKLLDDLYDPDLDTDGDGTPDAVSISLVTELESTPLQGSQAIETR